MSGVRPHVSTGSTVAPLTGSNAALSSRTTAAAKRRARQPLAGLTPRPALTAVLARSMSAPRASST